MGITKTDLFNDPEKEIAMASKAFVNPASVAIIHGITESSRLSYCINPNRWPEIKELLLTMFDQYPAPFDQDCC